MRKLIVIFTFLAITLAGLAADDVVIYGSVERSDAWVTSSQYQTGYYSVSLSRDFEKVGSTRQKPTVTDGAVYADGYCYYLNKTYASVVRYSLEWCKMNTTTWQVEETLTKSNGSLSLAHDMTYDPVSKQAFSVSPRSFGSIDTDLRSVDLNTGEFTTIAQMNANPRTLAANSKGELYGIGTEVIDGVTTTFLYSIDKTSGQCTRIGQLGFNMTESETGMAFDLRDDRLYWTANYYTDDELLQRTYKSGIVEVDTKTGKGTLIKSFANTEKVVGMFINTDAPNGPANLTPKAPTNIRFELSERDSKVTLNWDAPTLCEDERSAIDYSSLTYTVKRMVDSKIVTEGLTTTSYTDVPPHAMQNTAYEVTAVTPNGTSKATRSASFVCGAARTLPYLETFDREANFKTYTVIDVAGDGDAQNSGGLWLWDYNNYEALYYTNFHQSDDWLITPTLTLPTDRVLRLRFGAHGYHLADSSINQLEVTIGAKATIESQKRTLLSTQVPGEKTPEWFTALFIPQEDECRIGFHNVSDGSDHLFLDNVYVIDYGPLTIPAAPTAPAFSKAKGAQGVTISITASTTDAASHTLPSTNTLKLHIFRTGGTAPIHTFTAVNSGEVLSWIDNDVALGENSYLFVAENEDGHGLEITATYNNENDNEDENEGGDENQPQDPSTLLPYVTDLHLTEDGNLAWSDAITRPELHPVTESAESLEPFSIDGGNGWTTTDSDGARTIGISTTQGTMEWPHATEAQAFIVFNSSQLGIESLIAPRSGKQCFIAFASAGRANDDWLISPQLSGKEQTISFYAKCVYPENLNERFEVWASNSDTRIESFVKVSGEGSRAVTSAREWQKFRFTLSEGTRHFAIRCVSENQFGLMIDDIRFSPSYPAADLLGYNIYADGVRQNSEPVEDTSWRPTTQGIYTVRALFTQGESVASKGVNVALEGINLIDSQPLTDSGLQVIDLKGRKVDEKQALNGTYIKSRKKVIKH